MPFALYEMKVPTLSRAGRRDASLRRLDPFG